MSGKLKEFLESKHDFCREPEVMYLLVLASKEIERVNQEGIYPSLMFYRNWAVHPLLNHPDKAKYISEKFDKHIDLGKGKNEIKKELAANNSDFFKLEDLKKDIEKFLKCKGLDAGFAMVENWNNFCRTLLRILEDSEIAVSESSKQICSLKTEVGVNYTYRFVLCNGLDPGVVLKYKPK